MTPFLTVIIPTRDRARVLEQTIRSLFCQSVTEEFEIVVADNGSGDDTSAVLSRLQESSPGPMKVVFEPKPGPASARNAAVRASSGRTLLLLGDDTKPASHDLIQRHIDLHRMRDDDSWAVLGRISWSPSAGATEFMEWLDSGGPQFHFFELDPGPIDAANYFYSSHLSLSRSLFDSVGGFDERFPYAAFEDSDLGSRLTEAGLALEYHPELEVWHDHPTTISQSLDRAIRIGRSAAIYNSIHDVKNRRRIAEPSRVKQVVGALGAAPMSLLCHVRVPLAARKRIWMLAHRFRFAQGYRLGVPE